MKSFQLSLCCMLVVTCIFSSGALAAPKDDNTLVIGAGFFYGLVFIPSGSGKTSDHPKASEGNSEIRTSWRQPLRQSIDLEMGFAKGQAPGDEGFYPGRGYSLDYDYDLLHTSLIIPWPATQSRHQLFIRAGINLHRLDYQFSLEENATSRPLPWERIDNIGWQAGIGWRWRMDWGELGLDYTRTGMHPVYVRHVHTNIGWRF